MHAWVPQSLRPGCHQGCASVTAHLSAYVLHVCHALCFVAGPDGDVGGQGTYLTLRRLQLWLAEPLRRMRLLAALVDAADGCIGGDLAGRVWAASKVGDPFIRAYATRLLQQVRDRPTPLRDLNGQSGGPAAALRTGAQ
jgi:hypothetical protein